MNPPDTILVTGSSGSIGTRLCERLIEDGHIVVGADLKPNKWRDEVNQVTTLIDLRNKEDVLSQLPSDVDLVIHLAANPYVYNLVLEPAKARDNFEILFNMLEFSRQNHIKKFIFSSSREVYGNSKMAKHSEDDSYVKNCESPYAATKIGGEALVHSYQQCYGINFLVFRLSNVYGMYHDADRLIPQWIELCMAGQDLTVYGEDKQLDFTYIDDAVSGVLSGIRKFDEACNNTFNLAYGKGIRLVEVAKIIQESISTRVKVRIEETRTGEVEKYIADISKAKRLLGFRPQTDIEEGIKKTIEWFTPYIQMTRQTG